MEAKVKLVLLDLDGTLLDENSKVPVEFPKLVEKCKEKGVHIGIASGRNRVALDIAFGELFNSMACITNNGCANYIEGKECSFSYMDEEVCKKIYDYCKENQISFLLHQPEHILLEKGDQSVWGLHQAGFKIKECEDLSLYYTSSVMISIIDRQRRDHQKALSKIEGNFQMASPGIGIIDITSKGVSKAYGARQLAEKLSITMDEIMAIGDAGNDLDLLMHVGYPVAMLNGTDKVKKIAKYITPLSNAEHGVIHFLEEYFNL